MINIILFGPPGSGKGTQATRLVDRHQLHHISTGDLFRYNLGEQTDLGKQAKAYMDKGELVPDEVTVGMLADAVDKAGDVAGFIFDGFPRTIPQAAALQGIMAAHESSIHALLMLDVPTEELVKRLLDRGKDSGRTDDQSEETIRKRINVYEQQTRPVFDHYDVMDKSYSVDGLGSIDEITQRLDAVVDHLKSNAE